MRLLGIKSIALGIVALALALAGTVLLTRGPLPFAGTAIAGEPDGTAPRPRPNDKEEKGLINARLGF